MNYNFTRFIENIPFGKKARSILSALLIGASFSADAQYCIPIYDQGCSANDDINSFTLTGQGASNISDLNTGCGPGNGYEDRTSVVAAVDLMQGGTYAGTVTSTFSSSEWCRIWIDFNNNQVFEPNEALTGNIGPFGSSTGAGNFNISIPLSAPVGLHRMRVRVGFNMSSLIDPCAYIFFGETHDYMTNILAAPPCAGAPVITGVTPVGPIATCAGASQTLTVALPIAGGYTFDWQSSTNGGVTWSSVATGVTTYTFTVSGNADYRIVVGCTNSGLTDTSNVVTVTATPPSYASIPYFQDFETWQTYCSNSDIPSGSGINWTNNPSTGDNSWRRDDQGSTANWSSQWGAYFPASVSGAHSARFATDNAAIGTPGNLDLYVDCSAQAGGKQLYFYYINDGQFGYTDSVSIYLSTDGGNNFSYVGVADSATNWKKKTFPINSNSAQTIVRFQAYKANWDFTDMGIDSVYIAPPCTGAPVAGTIDPGGTIAGCPGTVYAFNTLGTSMAGNLLVQWQQSLDNGTTWTNVVGGSGANTTNYTSAPLFDTIHYRMYVVCQGSGLSDTSAPVIVNITSPVYATLPYVESFESWIDFCDMHDVPSVNWANNPSTGDMSWRRNDEGSLANWFLPTNGAYSPAAVQGSHSARFHSGTWLTWGTSGDLDMFVDCSPAGNKELQFYYINPSGFDMLDVMLSTNGGATFTTLASYMDQANWDLKLINIPSTSSQTVIRFHATNDGGDDIGIDYAQVLLPCTGMPVAGMVDSLTPCANQDFQLSLTGTSVAGGLSYTWQESPDGINWTNVPGGTTPIATYNIATPTYFRAIVACGTNADTSDAVFFDLASFYYCYCMSSADFPNDDDIGNFNVKLASTNQTVFNNGVANPLQNNPTSINTYSNFTNLTPIPLYPDSTFRFSVTQINEGFFINTDVAVYIDWNRDGVYDQSTEEVYLGTTAQPSQQVSNTFTIPSNAQFGLTGVRVVLMESWFGALDPCGLYGFGETEDYLAYIGYPPCNGAPDGGTAYISDTLLCPGFNITLTDTTHETMKTGLTWIWQQSADGVNWTDIPGTDSLDIINIISPTASTYYRLKMMCSLSGAEDYSNQVHITIQPPYECYCPSYADGGAADVSDNGALSIGNFIINDGGPHLLNPAAIHSRTAYENVIKLAVDSTYNVQVYHTMKNNAHQDAKVTLFIDFNNNFVYDVPEERVWTAFTTANDVFLSTQVPMPANAVKDVLTGMRLIINNDVNPNTPSDEACGTYTSGETEDFAVMFKNKSELNSVGGVNMGIEFGLFPNPTSGRVTVKGIGEVAGKAITIRITTVTGQVVFNQQYAHSGKEFTADIDLSDKARGVYLVELISEDQKTMKKLIVR